LQSRIERMAGHFLTIFNTFLQRSDLAIRDIDYLTPREKFKLFHVYNEPSSQYLEADVVTLFRNHVALRPESIALTFNGQSYTYAYINHKAEVLAENLISKLAIRRNGVIILLLARNELTIISMLAVWMAGGTFIPLDTALPDERIISIISATKPDALILNQNTLANREELMNRVSVPLLSADELADRDDLPSIVIPPADLAYIMFTSGSTGHPKGVEIKHSSLANIFASLKIAWRFRESDVFLALSNYTFDISLVELIFPIAHGGRIILLSSQEILNSHQIVDIFLNDKPSFMQATPAMWKNLIDGGWPGHSKLLAITCGEALSLPLKDELLSRTGKLWNLYGPTESTIFSTGTQITQSDDCISIGKPLLNTRVYILDSNGLLVPEGNFGELHIQGAGVATGYFKLPELTKTRFIESKFDANEILYKTGDIGRWLPDGNIELAGRLDEQVKIRGFRIELNEIESFINRFDGIRTSVVFAHNDDNSNQELVACVVWAEDQGNSLKALRDYLQRKLPAYMVPIHFIELPILPLNKSGKVDKKIIKGALEGSSVSGKDVERPLSPIEERLSTIWAKVLNRKSVGLCEGFFEIGGHSLKGSLLINQIFKEWGIRIKFSELVEYNTIEQQSELIRNHIAENPGYTYITFD
jgi:amino acid adenylation domain-containing protein